MSIGQACWWRLTSALPQTRAGQIKLLVAIVLVALVVALLIACAVPGSPVLQWLLDTVEWIENLPRGWSCVLMIELYAIVIPFGIPITPLNLVSGFLFDLYLGSLVAITGTSTLLYCSMQH
jgi:uncharacterized membrane protein YdjX (TVP38/TMEM64 family)